MLIGWLMGGKDHADRQLLATVTSIRNAGLCLLFAMTLFPGRGVNDVVLAYVLLMIPPNAVITIAGVGREYRRQKSGSEAGDA